jgi:hypothetical protein
VWQGLARLDRAIKPTHAILQLVTGGMERVSERDMRVLVPPGRCRVAADVDLLATGQRNVEANTIDVGVRQGIMWGRAITTRANVMRS